MDVFDVFRLCLFFIVAPLGSTRSPDRFSQVTGYLRLADVRGEIFETPIMTGCFAQERTVAKNQATTEMRDGTDVSRTQVY